MIRPEQRKQIQGLVEQYRKELEIATRAENKQEHLKLRELAREYVHMNDYETNSEYVEKLVNDRIEVLAVKLKNRGLGANDIHSMYPFGFAQDLDGVIEDIMHAEARTGKYMKLIFNPDYFFEYISRGFSSDESFADVTIGGTPVTFDENIYSYIIDFREEN